jgi:SPP1 family predicted phage head-tail adaptor
MKVNAGRLRETIEIQRVASVADGSGGFTRDWTKVRDARAEVLPLGVGAEQLIAEGLQPVQGFKILIRRDTSIGIDTRIVWNGQLLNVRSFVDPDGKRQWTQIIADAGRVAA